MSENIKIISQNKKARFNYFLSDFLEAGIVLSGTEIKSIRLHNVNLDDAYVLIRNNQAYVINMNIPVYEKGTIFNHEPKRDRKLLLHKYEIRKLDAKVERKGFTLIPTKVYLKNGKKKKEIELRKGKKILDKRKTIKQRENQREINKIMKEKRYEK